MHMRTRGEGTACTALYSTRGCPPSLSPRVHAASPQLLPGDLRQRLLEDAPDLLLFELALYHVRHDDDIVRDGCGLVRQS